MRGLVREGRVQGSRGCWFCRMSDHRDQRYIVGGSAMIVAYGRERTTRDVDARIEYAKDDVLAATEENSGRARPGPELAQRERQMFMRPARDDRARTVFNTPGLVVTGASAEHMLAMKIDAARNSDEGDIGVDRSTGDHERRSGIGDLPDGAAAHGRRRRAATGTRVEDRRREDETPAVSDRPPKSRTLIPVPALRLESDSRWILRSAASET